MTEQPVAAVPGIAMEVLVGRITDEFLERLDRGEQPQVEDYACRYPEVAAVIRQVFPALEWMRRPVVDSEAPGGPADSEILAGCLGDFRLLREIGRGGMGVVYEAQQISLRRRVALKVMPFAAAVDPKQLKRFELEAQAAACLHHTNIVPVHAVGCERGVPFYAMEYIEGCSLAQLIGELRRLDGQGPPDEPNVILTQVSTSALAASMAGGQPVGQTGQSRSPKAATGTQDQGWSRAIPETPPSHSKEETVADPESVSHSEPATGSSTHRREYLRTVSQFGVQIAEALDHAHTRGILHRDIKPGNLLLDAQGQLWITDFGLAQIQGNPGLTLTGDILGTLRYMSPEQALAKRVVIDGRTDIYSLGVTLYELLTLRPAIAGQDRMEILRSIADEEPRLLRQLNPAVPRDLETILLKAMAKEPGERYATAKDLADELRRFLEHKPIKARRPSLLDQIAKLSRRHRPVVWSAGVSLAVLLLTGVAGLATSNFLISRERDQKDSALKQRETALATAEANERAARASLRLAGKAVDELSTQLVEEMHELPRMQPLERKFLLRALEFYKELATQKNADPETRFETARGYFRTGRIQFQLGQHSEAEQNIKKAITLLETLVKEFPVETRYTAELASAYCKHFLVPKGPTGPAFGEADFPIQEAEADIRRAITLDKKLVADHPDEPRFRDALANAYHSLGYVLASAKRYDESEIMFRKVLAAHFSDGYQDVPDRRSLFASAYCELGRLLAARGRTDDSERNFREAAALFENIVSDFPDVRGYQIALVHVVSRLASLLQRARRPLDAVRAAKKAVELSERMDARWPDDRMIRDQLATALHALGTSLIAASRHDEAVAAYREAVRLLPEQGMFNNDLAWLLVTAPDSKLHDPKQAVRLAEKAVEVRPTRAHVWNTLGVARYRAGDYVNAIAALKKSEDLGQGAEFGFNAFFMAMSHSRQGDSKDARRLFDEAVRWMEENLPNNHELRRFRDEAAAVLALPDPPAPPKKEVQHTPNG